MVTRLLDPWLPFQTRSIWFKTSAWLMPQICSTHFKSLSTLSFSSSLPIFKGSQGANPIQRHNIPNRRDMMTLNVQSTATIGLIAKSAQDGPLMVTLDTGEEIVVMSPDTYASLLDKAQSITYLSVDDELLKDM
jgi:hypothetical protein